MKSQSVARAPSVRGGRSTSLLGFANSSSWQDNVWVVNDLRPGAQQHEGRINFAVDLGRNGKLTDARWAGLLESTKRFLYSLWHDPPRKQYLPTTVASNWPTIRVLLKWMVRRKYVRFSVLTKNDIDCFFEDLRSRRGKGRNGGLTDGTVRKYAAVFVNLFEQRLKLEDALQVFPFDAETATAFAGSWESQSSTPTIPDAVAIPIITAAMAWIRSSIQVIAVYNAAQAAYAAAWAAPRSRRLTDVTLNCYARAAVSLALREVDQTCLPPACKKISRFRDAYAAHARVIDACFIIIAAFSGIRASELFSIEEACIRRIKHQNGEEYYYLEGVLSKWSGEKAGAVVRWIVPKVVIEAVECLHKATAHAREASNSRILFLRIQGKGKVSKLSRQSMNFRINRFASEIAALLAHGSMPGWEFAAHQFRRKFAQFVARAHSRSHHALSSHFKHATAIRTDKSYVGTDFDLSELIDEEIQAEVLADVQSIVAGASISTNAAHTPAGYHGRIDKRAERNFIAAKIKEAKVNLQWFDGFLCMYDDPHALCEGVKARQGLDVCLNCRNGLILKKHRAYWLEQENMNKKILSQNPPPQLRKLAEYRIDEARGILTRMESECAAKGSVK